jgi:hypothetical protein
LKTLTRVLTTYTVVQKSTYVTTLIRTSGVVPTLPNSILLLFLLFLLH